MSFAERVKSKGYHVFKKVEILLELIVCRGKTIYLFGCPIHPNVGDQAQLYCIEQWLKNNYSDWRICKFNWSTSYSFALKLLRKRIGRNDLIFFHSGYFMVDHHRELPVYCTVANLFPDFKITVFPQTIYLSGEEITRRVVQAFNSHPNLTLMCRDAVSYETAKGLFGQCRLLLYPDIVTSMIGSRSYDYKRSGVLFCIRNDGEAFYSPEQISELRRLVGSMDDTVLADTSIKVSRSKLEKNRGSILEEMLESFSKYRLIITDRYHGTIFALVSNTPVIVVKTTDHKVATGVDWFKGVYDGTVVLAESLEHAGQLAEEMLKRDDYPRLRPHFQQKYYDKLLLRLNEPVSNAGLC